MSTTTGTEENQPTTTAVPHAAHWQRLSARIIWVDLVITALSIAPAGIAILFFDVDAANQIWPLIGLAAFGVIGAVLDVLRWIFTRFKITATYVEMKTGVIWRQRRSIQRDRIRSVDVEAKLRHRLSRMRVVTIGAGQQSAAGEAALSLDALSADDAFALQHELLTKAAAASTISTPTGAGQTGTTDSTQVDATPPVGATDSSTAASSSEPIRIFARFKPSWFIFNMFNIWAFVLAMGLGWGALWLLSTVGIDLYGFVVGLLDWDAIGWVGTTLIAVASAGALGAIGLGINYFTANWNLELARVPSREGTMLRTRKGLFTTREVNRDENRIRGAQVSEPVFWRWMGAADTRIITTGLDEWAGSEPSMILPRGPVRRAKEVASEVLGCSENPFELPLAKHPGRALRRRLVWATVVAIVVGFALWVLAAQGVLVHQWMWAALALWPVLLLAAWIAYGALGHRLTERYVIARSGLFNRATTVLDRSAVSTIVIRESVLQRRLKLRTVSAMTAAGDGGYDVPDIPADESLEFAIGAAPGLLNPFLEEPQTHRK